MMTKYPRVRIGGRFPGEATVPCNLEVEIDGGWVSLGTLGNTNWGGPGSVEKTDRYHAAVGQLVGLYLAAPALLEALPNPDILLSIADALAYRGITPASNVEHLRAKAHAIKEAIAQAKGEV